MGKQRDIQQRQRAIERNAQANPPEMARLGAAFPKKEVARDHKKQRHADAGGGIEQIGDIPLQQGNRMGVSDIPAGAVDHHHHHADEVFTSWGKETPKKYNKEELDTILQKLSKDDSYGMILRSKGILQTEDGSWIQFDLVPGEYEIREGSADYTGRICVIGSKLKEDELEGLFF